MIKIWVLEVPIQDCKVDFLEGDSGRCLVSQVQWLMMGDVEKGDQRKELLLTSFENTLNSQCH